MEKTQAHPTTKDAALRQLGVTSKKTRTALASQVEFIQVSAGRPLVSRGSFAPTVLVGVAGEVLISTRGGHVAQVEAPFVIGKSVADNRRIADVSVLAEVNTTLLLVDVRRTEAVFNAVPALRRLAATTNDRIDEVLNQPLDLTDLTERDSVHN